VAFCHLLSEQLGVMRDVSVLVPLTGKHRAHQRRFGLPSAETSVASITLPSQQLGVDVM
jgi:hypothetical protein